MRLIASDTSLLLPGLLSAAGQRRRLLVVLAYGAACYYARFGEDEAVALEQLATRSGTEPRGLPISDLIARAAEQKAQFEEHLPAMTPDDLLLVGGAYLFDEVERKLRERGDRIAKGDVDGGAVVRLLQALCVMVVPPFALIETPEHTDGRDRDDDPLIEIGLRGSAIAMVSDDRRHVSPTADAPTVYRDQRTAAQLRAYQFMPFVAEHVNTLHFDLADVDPGLLRIAYR